MRRTLAVVSVLLVAFVSGCGEDEPSTGGTPGSEAASSPSAEGGTLSNKTLAALAEVVERTCADTGGEFAESTALFAAADALNDETGDERFHIDGNELSRAVSAFFDLYRASRDEARDVSIMQVGLCQQDAASLVGAIPLSALES